MSQSPLLRLAGSGSRFPILQLLVRSGGGLTGIAVFSGVINVLALTGSLFMLQIYDRVLASHSIPTLISLGLITLAALVVQGVLETLRLRILSLKAEKIEAELAPPLFELATSAGVQANDGRLETLQPFRDLDAIRAFVSGQALAALFDLPWLPVFLVVLYIVHPWLMLLTLASAIALFVLMLLADVASRRPSEEVVQAQSVRNHATETIAVASEAARAMGMMPAITRIWRDRHQNYLAAQRRITFIGFRYAGIARTGRAVLQSAMLALAAYLAIRGQITAGAIVAASILGARAMAPVDQIVGAWRTLAVARHAWRRLDRLLAGHQQQREAFALPPPVRDFVAQGLATGPPGTQLVTVRNISFALKSGQTLGVIGASASGKTSLIRALVGAWPLRGGQIALDGVGIEQRDPVALGRSIGYLPQDVQLLEGTVAENIARFDPDAPSPPVIAAAEASGFHDDIVALPDGYNTRIGKGGTHLSAGQRQRLGLARALYGDPFLIVLDEPSSNLDAAGDKALLEAMAGVARRGGIVVVVTHQPSLIRALELLLVMNKGEVIAYGPRDSVLRQLAERRPTTVRPVEPVVAAQGGER